MKVYSLSGKSGTGKSYQALDLCEKYHIDAIIDDGLLIYNNRIIAGKSAKRQSTTIRAIKTALYREDVHRKEMIRALRIYDIHSVLIIGTSEKMIDIIAERLKLPEPEVRIQIESITTPEEREIADMHRHDMGEHIIPAPTMEIKKDFSGYFMHPVKRFKDLYAEGRWVGKKAVKERSVVRPTYSYLGRYYISERTITDIVSIVADTISGLHSISDIYIQIKSDGVVIKIGVTAKYDHLITEMAGDLQEKVARTVDEMTSLNILAVDIKIEGLIWEKQAQNL